MTTTPTVPLRLAEHLASEVVFGTAHCELASLDRDGSRCRNRPAALRWEDHFADLVCAEHAARARARGALVVYPHRHDGTPSSDDAVADSTTEALA